MDINELSLTPNQLMEVDRLDRDFVDAWLAELDAKRATIKSPTGFFIAAIRTGQLPAASVATDHLKHIRGAERWIRNVGNLIPAEDETIAYDYLHSIVHTAHNQPTDHALMELLMGQWRLTTL